MHACARLQASVAVGGERILWAPKASTAAKRERASAAGGEAGGGSGAAAGSQGSAAPSPALGPHNPIRQGLS